MREPVGSVRRLRPALGTLVRIEAQGSGDTVTAVDAAYREIERVESSMSFHRPDSEIRALMRAPLEERITVSPDLFLVLRFAKCLWRASAGVFDPAVGRALVANGLLPRPEGEWPDEAASIGDLDLPAADVVRFRRRTWIDLGGIAKGYAVDRALQVLRDAGVASASVNAGGDLACFGAGCRVHVRDPRTPRRSGPSLELRDAALATSAAYFQPDALRGRLGHAPTRRHGSVTVIARDCMTADALTKVVWAAPRKAAAVLDEFAARALSLDARARPRWLKAA